MPVHRIDEPGHRVVHVRPSASETSSQPPAGTAVNAVLRGRAPRQASAADLPSKSQAIGKQKPPRRRPWFVGVAGLAAVAAVGCSSDATTDAADAPATVTVTAEASPSTESVAPSPEAAPTSAAPVTSEAAVVVDFVMPNFVGTDLQTAQNAVQDNGVIYSVSHDLLGSRNQMLDSGWIVCTQNVAAGQRVTGDVEGQIDFGVVKREEFCP